MALTDFEKTMLNRIRTEAQDRKQTGRATQQDDADLETLTTGSEAERQSLVATYVTDTGISACSATITAADAEKTAAQTLLAEMEDYVA